MNKYYVIYFGEDGVTIETFTKDELLEKINDEDESLLVSDSMSINVNGKKGITWPTNCEPHKTIIIEGKTVIPYAVEKVTEYKID